MYWLLTVPAVFFPAARFRQTAENLIFGRARLIGVFGILATLAMLWRHDFGLIPPVILIVWVTGWACRDEIRLNVRHLCGLTLAFYVTGIAFFCLQPPYSDYPWLMTEYSPPEQAKEWKHTGCGDTRRFGNVYTRSGKKGLNLNAWGILPDQTAPTYGVWRISVTPNIATSGPLRCNRLADGLAQVQLSAAESGNRHCQRLFRDTLIRSSGFSWPRYLPGCNCDHAHCQKPQSARDGRTADDGWGRRRHSAVAQHSLSPTGLADHIAHVPARGIGAIGR